VRWHNHLHYDGGIPAALGMWGNNWWEMWESEPSADDGGVFVLSLIILVMLCYMTIAIVGGVGLLMDRNGDALPASCIMPLA